MRRLTLAAVLLAGTAFTAPASAALLTLSENNGSGPFGEITGFFNDATNTSYTLHVDMFDNNIINTGSHWPLTISLNTGTITQTATTFLGLGGPTPFSPQPHIVAGSGGQGGDYKNAPFSFFSDAVDGACGNGNSSGGCGQDMWLTVTGVNPLAIGGLFNPATNQFGGQNVWAAVDIFLSPSGPTFAVGLADVPVINPSCATPPCTFAVPGPIVGAGPIGMAAAGLFGLNFWRRRRNGSNLPA